MNKLSRFLLFSFITLIFSTFLIIMVQPISIASCPPHTYIYESQGNGKHTISCSKCGTRFGQGTCYPAPPESCTDCGNSGSGDGKNELEVECEHEYGDWKIYPSDRNKHIRYCVFGCESYETNEHNFGFLGLGTCSCGMRKNGTCKHKFSSWEKVDSYNHKKTCLNDCGAYEVAEHDTTRNYAGVCACGYTRQELCEHSFNSWKNFDSSQHSRYCTKCAYMIYDSHKLVWSIHSTPTCTKEGLKIYKCAYCDAHGGKESQPIPKSKHSLNANGECENCDYPNTFMKPSGEAICLHKNISGWESLNNYEHAKYCLDCNIILEIENHGNYNILTGKCACGKTKKDVCNHYFTNWFDTGTNDGHTRSCTICGFKETNSHTAAWLIKEEPTCTKSGLKSKVCKSCDLIVGEIESELIPPTGHRINNFGRCLYCNYSEKCTRDNTILGHVHSTVKFTILSDTIHRKHIECKSCGFSYFVDESHSPTKCICGFIKPSSNINDPFPSNNSNLVQPPLGNSGGNSTNPENPSESDDEEDVIRIKKIIIDDIEIDNRIPTTVYIGKPIKILIESSPKIFVSKDTLIAENDLVTIEYDKDIILTPIKEGKEIIKIMYNNKEVSSFELEIKERTS